MAASLALSVENKWTNGAALRQQPRQYLVRQFPNHVAGQVAPSIRQQDGAERMEVSRAFIGRTPRKPKSAKLTKHDTAAMLSAAIQEDYGRLASRHKQIANDAGAASEKTAEAWTGMVSLPGLHHFLNLGMESPALRKMVMRVWQMEADGDPDFQRELNDLIRRHLQK